MAAQTTDLDFTPLRHELTPHFPALRAIRRRADLLRSPLYAQIEGELTQLLNGIERGRHALATDRAAPTLRVVAWNIRRGLCFDGIVRALREDPLLRDADVLLLSEVDHGLGRSGNRAVARELAQALRMHYAFGVSYLTLEDDWGENPDGRENTLALAGAAVLSRLPLGRVENVDLPELRDKFSSSEKRLGKKRALLCEVLAPEGPLFLAGCHLDSNASPAGRAAQLAALLDRADAMGANPLLLGGDFNSTTYDASATWPLLKDLLHKYFVTGFKPTVDGYMTPERLYERPMFDVLAQHGLSIDGLNDRRRGTIHYDLQHPYAIQKAQKKAGRFLTWLLRRRLRPWNFVVPARLDWFAGRGVVPVFAGVADPMDWPRDARGEPVSDHAAVVVDIDRAALFPTTRAP